jgi:hypothetical protein
MAVPFLGDYCIVDIIDGHPARCHRQLAGP